MYDNDPVAHRLFTAYRNIRQMCYNPNNLQYRAHQQAGLLIECEFGSFQEFKTWALKKLGPPPFHGARIVRKDMHKNYSRTNLVWDGIREQQNRQRACHQITYRGKTQSVTQWARELDIKPDTIRLRIRSGLTSAKDILYQGKHRSGPKKKK